MVAVGITSKGKRIEFDCRYGNLFCYSTDLISLEIPEGVKKVLCWGNLLTELILPESVESLWCDKEVSGLDRFIYKIEIVLW